MNLIRTKPRANKLNTITFFLKTLSIFLETTTTKTKQVPDTDIAIDIIKPSAPNYDLYPE